MNARATPSTVAADEGVALAEGFARRIGALARRLQATRTASAGPSAPPSP